MSAWISAFSRAGFGEFYFLHAFSDLQRKIKLYNLSFSLFLFYLFVYLFIYLFTFFKLTHAHTDSVGAHTNCVAHTGLNSTSSILVRAGGDMNVSAVFDVLIVTC